MGGPEGAGILVGGYTVADPGFPRGGGANSPTYDFAKFSPKLHGI